MMSCVTALAVISIAACGNAEQSAIVARVEGMEVTARALAHWTAISARKQHLSSEAARARALDFLIVSDWVDGEARRRGVSATVQEVRDRLAARTNIFLGTPAEFQAALRRLGETLADARREAEVEVAYAKIERSVESAARRVPSGAVAAYYRRHKRRFRVPEKRFFDADTRTSEKPALNDRARILAGAPFPAGTIRESLSASEVGIYGPARTRIDRAIFAARPGVLIGPFQNEPIEDHTLVRVTAIVPARQKTLPQVRRSIEGLVSEAQEKRALEDFRSSWQLRWKAVTSCNPAATAPGCAGYGGNSAPLPLTL